MAQFKITCPDCGRNLLCDEKLRHKNVRCPHCRLLFPAPPVPPPDESSHYQHPRRRRPWSRARKRLLWIAAILVIAVIAVPGVWLTRPTNFQWPDRRPIGVLFLASGGHVSPTNPRGWFNDAHLDFTGTNGAQRFRKALLDYTDRSITILKRTGAQGVIVWDLEGEEYPHKATYIGDPRLLDRLAPEMAPVADEFFARLRNAGLKIGLTIRPQQLVFDDRGFPRQNQVINLKRILLEKIDYARSRWGATIFYVDSNGGIRRPDEVWQLRSLVNQRPGILLIPEHHYVPYLAFSAPYVALKKDPNPVPGWARELYPRSFRALDISDASPDTIAAARLDGDILLFRAWYSNSESRILENFAKEP